jgi:hypothetical protein
MQVLPRWNYARVLQPLPWTYDGPETQLLSCGELSLTFQSFEKLVAMSRSCALWVLKPVSCGETITMQVTCFMVGTAQEDCSTEGIKF